MRRCLSSEVLSTKRIRLFSQKARRYMVAYKILQSGDSLNPQIYADIEKMQKKVKTHRNVYDSHRGFCRRIAAEIRS